jgi:hypothetical protein
VGRWRRRGGGEAAEGGVDALRELLRLRVKTGAKSRRIGARNFRPLDGLDHISEHGQDTFPLML